MSIKVFYCYAHEDKALRATLEKHLGNLKRQELITGWSDRNIDAGKEWAKEIDSNLNAANIILLLISPDFMHSEYCYSIEMRHALERHENGIARVIPIILRPVEYEGAPFSRLQALPTDAVPVTDRKWRTRDEAFLDIAQGIRKVVKKLLSEQSVYEGNIHFYREQYEQALKAFERAISLDQENTLAFLGQGETLCQLISQQTSPFLDDRNQNALAAFEQAISLDKTNARAYVGKGKILFNLAGPSFDEQENDQMLEALEQAFCLDPENADAYLIMGDAFMALDRYKEAASAYQRAIEVTPYFNKLAYKGKGNALYNLERYEEAITAYNRVIQEIPESGDTYKQKGDALYHLDRYNEALTAYEQAIALSYLNAFTFTQKGDSHYQLKQYQEALTAYEMAIQLSSSHFEKSVAYKGKGNVLQALAEEAFNRARMQEAGDPFLPKAVVVKASDPDDPFLPDFPDDLP